VARVAHRAGCRERHLHAGDRLDGGFYLAVVVVRAVDDERFLVAPRQVELAVREESAITRVEPSVRDEDLAIRLGVLVVAEADGVAGDLQPADGVFGQDSISFVDDPHLRGWDDPSQAGEARCPRVRRIDAPERAVEAFAIDVAYSHGLLWGRHEVRHAGAELRHPERGAEGRARETER
jgi:hypothetical protein